LLNSFVDVNESKNYDDDFSKCTADRNMKGYTTALLWSKVFLQGKSFTSFSGSNVAFALLFPMETLFESYVASLMRKQLQGTDYSFSAQDKGYHLFDNPKKFMLRPDIVIKHKINKTVFVMDTKWKLLSLSKSNSGISQSDMYQMYAYQKKYEAKNITLLYPKTSEDIDEDKLTFKSDDGVIVSVKFVALYNKNSITDILSSTIKCDEISRGVGSNEY
jgi:5-methylcytosine-specific restriction enzyme subunit McrC